MIKIIIFYENDVVSRYLQRNPTVNLVSLRQYLPDIYLIKRWCATKVRNEGFPHFGLETCVKLCYWMIKLIEIWYLRRTAG